MFAFRYIAVIVFVVAGIVLSLSSIPLRSTLVDLDAKSQAISISFASDRPSQAPDKRSQAPNKRSQVPDKRSLSPFVVTSATFYGAGEIESSNTKTSFQTNFTVNRLDTALPLMSLQGLTLETDAQLKVRKRPGLANSFEIQVQTSSPQQFTLLAQGHYEVETDGVRRDVKSEIPEVFQINMSEGAASLALTLAEPEWSERRPFSIGSLSFFDGGEEDGVPYHFSALDTGHIRFGEINLNDGKNYELELRSGQPFFMVPQKKIPGLVRYLMLSREGISIQFSGDIKDVGTGWDEEATTHHMPTLLAYISSKDWVRHTVSGVLAVLGLLLAYFQVRAGGADK
jgi:hypothetical protein